MALQVPVPQAHHQPIRFPPHHLRRLDQAALRVLPAAGLNEPVLDQHRRQLGIDLTQDAPALLGAPFVDLPTLFPQAKEPFDLPPDRQHH